MARSRSMNDTARISQAESDTKADCRFNRLDRTTIAGWCYSPTKDFIPSALPKIGLHAPRS